MEKGEKSFLRFSPAGLENFLHIVEHSVTDRMKNSVLIQFVNGYLGHEIKVKLEKNGVECET